MKRLIVLACIIWAFANRMALAEEQPVFMEYHQKSNSGKNTEVNRSANVLDIEVVFDADMNTVEVKGDVSTVVEVFICDANGEVECHSMSLNVSFVLLTQGNHTIIIKGIGWYAEGHF